MSSTGSSSSRPTSSETVHSSSKKRRRPNTTAYQTRTSFVLAYPAPVYTDKTLLFKHLRPRLYLQLQKLSDDGRHYQPAIDVLSLAPPKNPRRLVTSALRRCVGKLRTHGSCLHFDKRDILLAKMYDDDDDDDGGHGGPHAQEAVVDSYPGHARGHSGIERVLSRFEDLTERNVVAVLRANNKIVTQDGRTWTASRRPNGSFEFASSSGGERGGGEDRCVARWVSSRSVSRLSTGSRTPTTPMMRPGGGTAAAAAAAAAAELSEAEFSFSLIDPGSRRHAVLATLNPSSLDIKDTYQQPVSPASGRDESMERAGVLRVVDENTRTLILATAVWLDLYLGWSPSY